jgi:hypothetical protein
MGKTKIIVLAFLILSLLSVGIFFSAMGQATVVKAEASSTQPHVGDMLTVNVKISNAHDLYGVDLTLNWDPSVLKIISASPQLGVESHSNGVLHESSAYPIHVEDNSQSDSEYHLLATSTGASTASFSGSGTIATLQFNVTSVGATGLALDAELSQRSADGQVNLVTPSTSVDAITPVVPEFPTIAIVATLAIATTASIVIATMLIRPKPVYSSKTSFKHHILFLRMR